jgi:hypothetical protein
MYQFLKNLDLEDRMLLISKLANSESNKTDHSAFFDNYGKLETDENADEIIDTIYSSRKYNDKNITL